MISAKIESINLTSAALCLPGKANEDRFSMSNEESPCGMITFGVFDGHGGSFGSQLCAQGYCSSILNAVNSKLPSPSTAEETVFDAIFCEAVYNISKFMNKEMKAKSRTGTTAVCVFVRRLIDGSHQVYCVNIGDSRYCCTLLPYTSEHTEYYEFC